MPTQNSRSSRKTFRRWTGKIHLYLGLLVGPIIVFMGITGCILAFEREIRDLTEEYRFRKVSQAPLLPPSRLRGIADGELPGKLPHSVRYQPGMAAAVSYYSADPAYFYMVYLDPYTGEVFRVKDMNRDFFRVVLDGHFYLWLPPHIGQPIIASATLIFVVMLISGLILWWPRGKAAGKQRFTIKWSARWKRRNYDLHNVLGFYVCSAALVLALTGLVWGFQWFARSVYWVASGGEELLLYEESYSAPAQALTQGEPAEDRLWRKILAENPGFRGAIDVHVPLNERSAIEIAVNPDPYTYWKADYRYFDQYTLEEIPVRHVYGRLAESSTADKLLRMNYDIHVGAIGGLPGKILAFCASLIIASLPISGFLIWRGRRKKASLRRPGGKTLPLPAQEEQEGAPVSFAQFQHFQPETVADHRNGAEGHGRSG